MNTHLISLGHKWLFPGPELIESELGPSTIFSHRLHRVVNQSIRPVGRLLPLIYSFSFSLIRIRALLVHIILPL